MFCCIDLSESNPINENDSLSYNTMKRFISAMASNEEISYELAYEKHQKEISEISSNTSNQIGYKTINKSYIINDLNNQSIEIKFIVEAAYVYDTRNSKIQQIFKTYISNAYVSNTEYSIFDHGDYSFENMKDCTGISVIGRFCFIPDYNLNKSEKFF
ncbi:MAG: hypothetical protein U0L05_00930 [Schaedlerella sp.]|nr:hypothetical protein [Schaedlerella sp.]